MAPKTAPASATLTLFGARLVAAMCSRGITTSAELARLLDVAPSTVHRWLYATVRPIDAATLLDLSRVLDTSFAWLLTGEGSPTKPRRLTPDADFLLSIFERLPPRAQERLISHARAMEAAA
ncbi:MAG: helix-turn-helix domain-containing protein [Burkholderiales bacterium]|nr:helix-turn-helix domain-containing protein [Burkholderiales bacterium]